MVVAAARLDAISRAIFIAEMLIIVAPLSLLFATFGFPLLVSAAFVDANLASVAVGSLALVALLGLLGGWVLGGCWISLGPKALAGAPFVWWLACWCGMLEIGAAGIVELLPPAQEYSALWQFRANFELFALGLPLLAPFSHMLFERYRISSR